MKLTRRRRVVSLIPVASMADIAFLLLIFLMLSGFSDMARDIPLQLPFSSTRDRGEGVLFSVTLTGEGTIYLNSQPVSMQDLASYATYRRSSNPLTGVRLAADGMVRFELINEVLELLKEAGIYRILFITRGVKDRV